MKKVLSAVLILFLSFSVSANEEFINFIKTKKVSLAYDNGDVHEVTFQENRFGVVTANYKDEEGNLVKGMSLKIITSEEGVDYLRAYKGLRSPGGNTYKYPMLVFIPVKVISGETRTFVDARWGYYLEPLVFLE